MEQSDIDVILRLLEKEAVACDNRRNKWDTTTGDREAIRNANYLDGKAEGFREAWKLVNGYNEK